MRYRWLAAAFSLPMLLPLAATGAPARGAHPSPAPAAVPVRGAPASFAELSARLLPMVVNIATTQTLKPAPNAPGLPNVPPGSPLADLFKDFLGPGRNLPRHVTSLGSGFIVDPSGYIVTNNHVIADAEQISVTLNDGANLSAKLIGRDEKTEGPAEEAAPGREIRRLRHSPYRRLGDCDRQSLRTGLDGDGGNRFGA
jgi:S1-C subfamily serine protease